MRSPAVLACWLALTVVTEAAPASAPCLPLEGQAAAEFLTTADVVAMKPLPFGVTKPFKVTLDDGERTAHAVWKTIDTVNPRHRPHSTDRTEVYFRDSYHHEVAAYELDKLLGLGLVPPTIERRIDGQLGSLQLWIEDAVTEAKRMKLELEPPDSRRWSERCYAVRLFHQLTGDTDASNVSNILVDPDFRVYVIDSSRAFHLRTTLHRPEGLRRFPRPVLERLLELSPEVVEEKLGPWLTPGQREALLARRDRLVELAERLIAAQGEQAALFAWPDTVGSLK